VKGPATIIIGTVVLLRDKLDWYVPEEQSRDARSGIATVESSQSELAE
jgi:hypothetical protein